MAAPNDYEEAYGRLAQYNIVDDDHPDVAQRMEAEADSRAREEAAEKAKKEKAAASRKNTKTQIKTPAKPSTKQDPSSKVESTAPASNSNKSSPPKTSASQPTTQASSSIQPSSSSTTPQVPGRTAGLRRQNGYIVSTPYPSSTSALDILKGPWDRIRYEALWRVSKEYAPAQIVATFNANHPVNEHLSLDVVTGRIYTMKGWYAKENGLSKDQVNQELENARAGNGVGGRGRKK